MNDLFSDVRRVQNERRTINYAVAGPERAVTVCLVASTGRGPEDFAHLTKYLVEAGMRVVLPRPCIDDPECSTDFHDLATDAALALDTEAGGAPAFVAGHAYGCWIARTMAQDFPDLVDGVILLAAGAGKWPGELSKAIEVAMSDEAPESERLDALRLAFFAPGHDPRPWLSGWNPNLVRLQRAARGRTDRDSWWSSGTAPMLDIVGLQDPFRPKEDLEFYVKEFAQRVTLRTVDGASHALPDEKPKEVAELMLDWLRKQGALPK